MSHLPPGRLPTLKNTPTHLITSPMQAQMMHHPVIPIYNTPPNPIQQPSMPQVQQHPLHSSAEASTSAGALQETFDGVDFDEDELLGEGIQIDPSSSTGRKRLFNKELRLMMYGFGDDENPYTESVDLLEDLVIEFITEMTHRAMEIGRTGRVQVEDIIYLVRKDQRKYARVKDLLTMNEELKKARKAFDEIKYVGAEAKIK